MPKNTIKPQAGAQTQFLSSEADIAVLGGAAGGGKTYSILLEPLRHCALDGFSCVTFRRETPQIRNPGGLWDKASELYPRLGGIGREGALEYQIGGATLKYSHLEREADIYNWQGSEIALLCFDELTHFTEKQFWYMLGRNRSMCGIRPYVRATCNPDPDSFVAKLVEWYIGDDGFAIPERSGVLRYFIREDDTIRWGDTRAQLVAEYPDACRNPITGKPDGEMIKSFTFIPAKVFDNKILLTQNPEYLANLKAQDRVTRARLLDGNWKIRAAAGMYFQRGWFEIVDAAPADARRVRYWDRAATAPHEGNKDPDWTAGVKMSRNAAGFYFIEHCEHFRLTAHRRNETIRNTASADGNGVRVVLEQEPGSGGKVEAEDLIRMLAGYNVRAETVSKDKITRASPFSAQCEAGNVKIVRGKWNDDLINELENFDGSGKSHDDIVDACSGAFNDLARPQPSITIVR